MIKKISKNQTRHRQKSGSHSIIWIVRELEYRAGLSFDIIASRHGVKPETVMRWPSRYGWKRALSPTERIAKRLTVEITRAEEALAEGDIGDAEKRVRAAAALGRAAQILIRLSEDQNTGTDSMKGSAQNHVEQHETEDFRAELERRLLRIIDAVEGQSENSDLCQGLEPIASPTHS